MKCEVCLGLLEEYLDGELPAEDQEQINAHLITCAECSAGFTALTAEQELFSRYDREVEVPPFLWTRIAQHTVATNNGIKLGRRARITALLVRPSFAGAVAILLFAIGVGVIYFKKADPTLARNGTDLVQARVKETTTDAHAEQHGRLNQALTGPVPQRAPMVPATPATPRVKRKARPATRVTLEQSGVLSSNLGYLGMDDRDTAKHIEQTEILLRSIRNVPVPDGDEEIDVSYDKALSRRLLNENVVLRREAEMKAQFPTKSLLADLEPFLIDIANLPDHARPEDVRAIKDRVQKTEIVAALMTYQDRGPNDR